MSDIVAGRMPTVFLGHGNPMNAIADNEFTRALATLAENLPRPRAVLVVSAHWNTEVTRVLASESPRTIHDFGGFPRELYEVQYPAPGAPEFAERVCELAPSVKPDTTWGLDHASWAVLRHMWPDADVPVFELSLDATLTMEQHYELGRAFSPLRDEGVLILGSGNIVHSFAGLDWSEDATPRPWAEEFDAWVADVLVRDDRDSLVDPQRAGAIAEMSVDEHYLPLIYAVAASEPGEPVTFPYVGIEMASMSMRCVQIG